MILDFHHRHISALISGSLMVFDGLWPPFNAQAAMLEFGLPARIANTPAEVPVMVVNVRATIIGALMLLFYSR
ncbi:hypothetical protein J3458_006827 [Metarhizium acridum]|uniref:uncharacterized protein n=1 Tax=Metarhizium acridum TaxID=92637 RepID=UPI001C6B918E|nr:hypothetical protein J3458_006827 [Metarhizium acridum]